MSATAQLMPSNFGFPDAALFRAAVEAFPESMAIVAAGFVAYANPAWCAMFECGDSSRLCGQTVAEIIPEQSLSVVSGTSLNHAPENDLRERRVRTMDSGTRFVRVRKDGARLQLELVKAEFVLRGEDFQLIHARDVTRQAHAETHLQESQGMDAIGRLVGGVAHDFNNLLTGILLFCDLLIGELKKDSPAYRHAQEMRRAGENGTALVQQLLGVARPSENESRRFGLNEVVIEIQNLLARLIGEHIALRTSLAPDTGTLQMDPAQVQQILLNLVLNARDAMPDGGEITLTTRNHTGTLTPGPSKSQAAGWVELIVTDTGCGMDAETLDHAFEPFFTTKKPGRGNGLGLATARRLAERQGGSIEAESQPGEGTRIVVRLPRVQPDAPPSVNSNEVIS